MTFYRPLLYAFIILAYSNTIANAEPITEVERPVQSNLAIRTNSTAPAPAYAWTSWGKWSPCSRTCGGGVSVQERHCLPRDPSRLRRSRKRRKLFSRSDLVRRGLNVYPAQESVPDCVGLARRYHECNTAPCPGIQKDVRAEQCSIYDRRPFRGRFYTWVPYIDGDAPCTLNCRPRGQQFYASLALVTDGTPCTKPGFRAICVQGECKVVGRETVLASSETQQLQCGSQLVSGLFTRPRLPLGYTHVTTVPRGACMLNVSEMISSDNYIALKVTNGSFILNGEFAVSAPGTYDAAGTRFYYKRIAGLDSIHTEGPLHHAIDIMVLYTKPNPTIKYEFLIKTNRDETSNDIPTQAPSHHALARHHRHRDSEYYLRVLDRSKNSSTNKQLNTIDVDTESLLRTNIIGTRKFVWKILSFTHCSRTCGGGLQIGKYKCVEIGENDKEVSQVHCTGSPPPSRRRRCGGAPCPPRWRASAWGICPVCGPAQRTRIVGCVQDHARGITKISDQKCPLPMPPNTEPCNVPHCDKSAAPQPPRLDAKRQTRPKDTTETFRQGAMVTLAVNISDDTGSTPTKYTYSAAGGWLYTEWSECVGWCLGKGVQSRIVRCADPSGCATQRIPESIQSCKVTKQCEAEWFTSEWSPCSAQCSGRQVRGVICISSNGRRLRDNYSCNKPKPETERPCGEDCKPSWYLSDWSECQGPCEAGVQSRTVWCGLSGVEGANGAARDADCLSVRPPAYKTCVPARCSSRPKPQPQIPLLTKGSDPQQRVMRHQSQNSNNKERSNAKGACIDKLTNCMLAVQARLCHYPYYAEYCCHSCHKR